jgi:hypothetical protein
MALNICGSSSASVASSGAALARQALDIADGFVG